MAFRIERKKPIVIGPVPSRRFGQYLEIVNVCPKNCTYNCIYCQLGTTKCPQTNRSIYYKPSEIYKRVATKIDLLSKKGEQVDYLTIAPLGEPSLDKNIGKTIRLLKTLGIKVAIITNSSLINDPQVRNDFVIADCVSVKVDSVLEESWHQINRPGRDLNLREILLGIVLFADDFEGRLITETLFVEGLNHDRRHIINLVDFLHCLNPETAYITIPIHPPTEDWVIPPNERILNQVYQHMSDRLPNIELLINDEGKNYIYNENDLKLSLLDTIAVHPLKEKDVKIMLDKAHADWSVINELLVKNLIIKTRYQGENFFLRRYSGSAKIESDIKLKIHNTNV